MSKSKLLKGNWYEENALESLTGCRYYPDPKDKVESALMTNSRTIVMTERIEPKDYKSSQHQQIVDPSRHPDYIKPGAKVGPRQRLLEQRMMRDIEEETKKEAMAKHEAERKINYVSLASDSFKALDPGFKPSLTTGDPTTRLPTYNADYASDTPITYYSHEVKKETTCNFPMSFVRSSNPFRKCNSFSNDIRSSIGKQAETHEHPVCLPTSKEYSILLRMVRRILSQLSQYLGAGKIPGSTVAVILAAIYDLDSKFNGKCSVEDLLCTFSTPFPDGLGVNLFPQEADAISKTFDLDNDNCIYLRELSNLVRPSLTPRRLELVEIAFFTCDQDDKQFITEEDMRRVFNGQGYYDYIGNDSIPTADEAKNRFFQSIQLYLVENNSLDLNDFVDYYSCVSAEVVDDAEFEKLLKAQWFS